MKFFEIFTSKHHRQLLSELTKREIAQRYKQSILGYFWVILNPLAQMLVMSFVFSKLFRVAGLGVPYSVFLFAGLLPWTLFAGSLSSAANALVGNAGLLSKIYFPREILVASTILAKVVDYFLASLIFILMMIFFKVPVTWNLLWFVPIFLIQNLFSYAIGIVLSAFNLFYRDIQYLLSLILLIWMYLTPIVYSAETFPAAYRWIFQFNPMAIIINAYRQVILAGGAPNFMSLGIAALLSVILFIFAFRLFKKLEGQFADAV
jgi:ABC-type polysaccharide/polyol phosphate export permease